MLILRCLIATAVIGGAQVLLERVTERDAVLALQAANLDIAALPAQLGDWTSEDIPLDDDVIRQVGALQMIERTYVNSAGTRLSILVSTFAAGEAILPHPPDLCYTGAGWQVHGETWQTDARQRRYKRMDVERHQQQVLVAYWYQLRRDVVSNRQELRRSLQRLRWNGQTWPPMVKVLIHAPIGFSEAGAQSDSEELGAAIFDWIAAQTATRNSSHTSQDLEANDVL